MKDLDSFDDVSLLRQLVQHFWQSYFLYHITENRFILLSPACAPLLGTTTARMHQNPAAALEAIHPQDLEFVTTQFRKLALGNGEQAKRLEKIEFRVVLADQKRQNWLCVAAHRLEEGGQAYIGGYVEDITQQKEYLFNILKFNAKKNATLEILSHDLAAPFANIQGLGDLLIRQVQEGNTEEVQQTLAYMKENAKKGSDMIRDFVDNEFLESSQVTLNKVRLDLVLRLRILLDNYKQQQQLVLKRFELEAPSEPIFIHLDEMKFMQVLNNLISNAIKFTFDEGTIKVKLTDRERNVLITVEDNGIGIPEEVQPYVFDKFTKARRPGIRGEKSVGLGMSIIRNIVEWHNGHIWFESEEGKGATFYIEIPKV